MKAFDMQDAPFDFQGEKTEESRYEPRYYDNDDNGDQVGQVMKQGQAYTPHRRPDPAHKRTGPGAGKRENTKGHRGRKIQDQQDADQAQQ